MNTNSSSTQTNISWAAKIKYVGTGIIIGIVLAPAVSKALLKFQPKINQLFDSLTGKTEEFAESAADLLARAQQSVSGTGKKHAHEKSSKKPKSQDINDKKTWTGDFHDGSQV